MGLLRYDLSEEEVAPLLADRVTGIRGRYRVTGTWWETGRGITAADIDAPQGATRVGAEGVRAATTEGQSSPPSRGMHPERDLLHSYWIASRMRVPAARRAGSTAASTPTTTARSR